MSEASQTTAHVRGAGVRLSDLVREIPGNTDLRGDGAIVVYGVKHDSRLVEPGDLFVMRKGEHADGAAFAKSAVEKGAVALLAPKEIAIDLGVPVISVGDIKDGLAFSSACIYGHPSFAVDVVGITGTNGKTTTSHLVRAAINGALGGEFAGLIGTVGHTFKDIAIDASHTTPEADETARVMALMKSRGASHVAMEVSSIALTLGRARAIRFRVAAFTNLTQDHLDFHQTMSAYGDAKAILFTELGPASCVVNVGDAFGVELAKRARTQVVRVRATMQGEPADIFPKSVTIDARGIRGELQTPLGALSFTSRLIGAHNLENLVVAFGIAHALELDLDLVARSLATDIGAPGRLERCDEDSDGISVLVDYAHTPDALVRVVDALRPLTKGRLFCLFGCGGDRDKTKRGPMGDAASSADIAIVTSDNPRTEDPIEIAKPIVEAVRVKRPRVLSESDLATAPQGHYVELDRGKAIALAIQNAQPGDVVLLAGKGHEDYQIIGTEKRVFDDRVIAKAYLAARRAKKEAL